MATLAALTDSWSVSLGGCVHAWCDAPATIIVGSHFCENEISSVSELAL